MNEQTHETCLVRDGYFAGAVRPFVDWMKALQGYDEATIRRFREMEKRALNNHRWSGAGGLVSRAPSLVASASADIPPRRAADQRP